MSGFSGDGNFSGFFQFQTPFLLISKLLPHFSLEWNICHVVYICPRALVTGEALLCRVTGDPPSLCLQLWVETGGRLVAQGRARGWCWFRQQLFLAFLFFQSFVLLYLPALNSLLAKRISSVSKEMPTKQLWYFLSPQRRGGLWGYCDSQKSKAQSWKIFLVTETPESI